MIVYAFLLLLLGAINGDKLGDRTLYRGDRFRITDYTNAGLKNPTGVGVLKELSNANILSHEPFIINFEFPNLVKSGGGPRKSRYGAKRSRRQRKKNKRYRRFRHVVLPDGDLIERTKRFQLLQGHPSYGIRAPSLLAPEENRRGKYLLGNLENKAALDKSNLARFLKFENEDPTPKPASDPPKNILQQIISPKLTEDNSVEETIEANNHKQWEDIKNKWMSLFSKDNKEPNNEMDEEEEKLRLKSHKMWANCQLLKLLKAPQRNPFFYKLLPPNYPALIMDEEKQLQCNKVYDIIDLSRDKQMIADKIEQLEKILSSEFKNSAKVPEMILNKAEETSNMRRKRDVEMVEKSHERENTLHDETLQGKSEGDGRSDRSSRTKKRQRNRDRSNRGKEDRSKGENKGKGRTRKEKKDGHSSNRDTHQNEHHPKHRGPSRNSRMAEPSQIATNEISKITRLDEKLAIEPDEESSEQKREKMEIKKDSILQDVFKPSEVSKVIKQKELEANIFDKVVRTMKKFEENNPYDESFKPQKRESRNETEVVTADSGESILEVDDAVSKLAQIFKILGVRAEAKKCENCDSSEEDASDEDGDRKGRKLKMSKQTRRCTCREDCPLCQDCLKCFRECKKNAVASKNVMWNKEMQPNSLQVDENTGLVAEKKPDSLDEGETEDAARTQNETGTDRGNSIKIERTYRTKLPASKDQVKLYYDNPYNKVLVWTKRGRRTMPWGPLTSDLQLYRDRARRILKSAEDILQRIKDTEEKLHASEQYGEKGDEDIPDKDKKDNDMDDIIKKVVSEDATKSILQTPWEAELNKTRDNPAETEKETVELLKGDVEEEDTEKEEIPDYQMEDDNASKPKSENQLKSDEKVELEKVSPVKDANVVKEREEFPESESVEADVESIERQDAFEKVANDELLEKQTDAGEMVEMRKSEEIEDDEYEDFPAIVQPMSGSVVFPSEMKVEQPGNFEERSEEENREENEDGGGESVKLEKTYAEESKEVDYGTEENVASESAEEAAKRKDKSLEEPSSEEPEIEELEDDKAVKSMRYESEDGEIEKSASYRYKPEELGKETMEKIRSFEDDTTARAHSSDMSVSLLYDRYDNNRKGPEDVFTHPMESFENSYIIKGVKKTPEEKEKILQALMNAEGNNEQLPEEEIADLTEEPEIVEQTTPKAVEDKEGDAFKTLVDHISNGHMDAEDLREAKKLDETKIDLFLGELRKKDKQPTKNITCDKQIKLCQIACGCNGTEPTTDIDKYDIIKGFLGWIKNVQIDQMVPISV